MKKFLTVALSAMMAVSVAAGFSSCGGDKDDFKVGVVLLGDATEGYTKAHIDGITAAAEELGLKDNQIKWKYKIPESEACANAAEDLVNNGCKVIFSNSYGHQDYMYNVAKENQDKDITFVAMTGNFGAICGLDNLKNAFTNVYESRYVSGVVAGMKVKELVESNTIDPEETPEHYKDGKVKIGYVGAHPFAEVKSGYTSFFLGVQSVYPDVCMEVKFTDSWFDIDREAGAAETLVNSGCVIIGQHADSSGAPSKCQQLLKSGKICYSVGYNVDMLQVAPDAALTSATNTWKVYYKEAIGAAMEGKEIPQNWAKGYKDGAVAITRLGTAVAPGTAEAVTAAETGLKNGTLKVFDTSKFTVNGEKVTTCKIDLSYIDFTSNPPKTIYEGETIEAIVDGEFKESHFRAAPYFSLDIDGITLG